MKPQDRFFDLLIALVGVLTIAIIFALAAVTAIGCSSRTGQATLKAGTCVLDTSVLAIVLADLALQNYPQLVADLETKLGPDVVLCALQAVATSPAVGPGSAVATSELPIVTQRARELLAARKR